MAKRDVPAGVWDSCDKCGHMVYQKEVEENLHCCPECGHHVRINARTRIDQIVDPGSFDELYADLSPTDPLKFKDRIPYRDRLKAVQRKTGERECPGIKSIMSELKTENFSSSRSESDVSRC